PVPIWPVRTPPCPRTLPGPSPGCPTWTPPTRRCSTRSCVRRRWVSPCSAPTSASAGSTAPWPGCTATIRTSTLAAPPADLWPAESAAQAESAARRVLSEDQPVFESGPDASQAQSWFPCHDQQGRVSGVGLIVANVGGQPGDGDTIRRSEERYRSLVQGGAQMVWVADAAGGLIEDCPEWRWVTGQTQEQYLGQGWLDAVHPEDRDRVERDWLGCVKSGKTFDDRYRVRTR